MNLFRFFNSATLFLLALLWCGCANIVPPEGGKKDETAPILLSVTPADSSLNIRPSRIVLRFNEYIDIKDLDKNLSLSPLLPVTPTVISYGKRVEIKLQDTQLVPNTTYSISLGDALVDNHEANPYKNFSFLFSTGSYFDSLTLQGKVFDAETGVADTSIVVMLYTAPENDTAVLRKKPQYAAKADGSGSFHFKALPRKAFRMYALQDANNNYLYDLGEEKIGFIDQEVMPAIGTDSLYTFYTFKEVADTSNKASEERDSTGNTDKSNALAGLGKRSDKQPKNKTGYRVNADTTNLSQRSFELTKPLTIDLQSPLKSLDTAKVYLSYENDGIEVEAVQQLHVDSGKRIVIHTQWQSDKVYTLRLVKGWGKDTSGAELLPGKYFFHTKREEDYGKLSIHINRQYYGPGFVLYVYKGADSIYRRPVTDSIVNLNLLEPGDYGMRIIVDANRNGKWDPGVLLKHIQPEKVVPYSTPIPIKAGWENEIDFQPPSDKKGLRGASDKPAMGASPEKLKEPEPGKEKK